jgi:ferritin
MFHPDIQNALNQQMNEDFNAWYFYRAGTSYCEEINLPGLAKWFRKRSDRKYHQATKVSAFVLQRLGHVDHRSIHPPKEGWDSVLQLLESARDHERRLGESIGAIMNLAFTNRDHSTHDFLEPFAREQAQADGELDRITERLKLVSDAPAGLFMFDEALA